MEASIWKVALLLVGLWTLADAQSSCVQFCSTLQVLQGECVCTTTVPTTRPTTSPRPRGVATFCPNAGNMVAGSRCPTEIGQRLSCGNLVTLLTTGEIARAGIKPEDAAALGDYLIELGNKVKQQGPEQETTEPPAPAPTTTRPRPGKK